MIGFRFMATVFARSQGADVNYLEDPVPQKLISLDKTEGYFKALSEAAKRHGA